MDSLLEYFAVKVLVIKLTNKTQPLYMKSCPAVLLDLALDNVMPC
jgi:hypothetical protein